MSWFIFALISTVGWGCADLFYKKGTDENDKNSHLKIGVWVGLIMGICALILLPFAETPFTVSSFFTNTLKYSPASFSYIISMIIGYAGLRYLELSIVSPLQNASGALSAICMLVYFLFIGKITNFFEEFTTLQIVGTIFIIIGVIALAIVENKLSKNELKELGEKKKYRFGALALLFPLLYCVFDTVGTAADGIILDEEAGLGLGEIDVLVLYGLTFFAVGIVLYFVLWIKEKKPYNLFKKSELPKFIAACCEQFGQIFYVFAMASNPVLAAPMIASYCIISIILSRIFIKEKLKINQWACVISVLIGIVMLGIADGIAEL